MLKRIFGRFVDHTVVDEKIETPEGYLIWTNVPIARTGIQLYTDKEVPSGVEAKNGIVQMVRDSSEVFNKKSLASFVGKPIVENHPTAYKNDVNNKNWSKLAKGIVLNAYKKDNCNTYVYGDVMITDEELQKRIKAGKVQVSAGYNSRIEQIKAGFASQHDIYINHLAVVDKGRAGSFCRIGDSYTFKDDLSGVELDYANLPYEDRVKAIDIVADMDVSEDRTARLAALYKLTGRVNDAVEGEKMSQELLAAVQTLTKVVDGFSAKLDAFSPSNLADVKNEATQTAPTSGAQDRDQRAQSSKELYPNAAESNAQVDVRMADDFANVSLFLQNVPNEVTLEHKRQAVAVALADNSVNTLIKKVVTDVTIADAIQLNTALLLASTAKKETIDKSNSVSNGNSGGMFADQNLIMDIEKNNKKFWERK